MKIAGVASAAFALLVWGVTFANTRALLVDFSALEIMVVRFAMAWVVLLFMDAAKGVRVRWCGREEGLFFGMGLTGVFTYQFLENCAIYYTNASNVAILVSAGPIITAAFARVFTKDNSLSWRFAAGSLIAMCGVALVSWNGVVNFHLQPLGDLMALGAMTSWGAYSVLVDTANARGLSPLTVIRKSFGWALVIMLPLVAWGVTEGGSCALDGSFRINFGWTANVVRFGRTMNLVNLFFLGVLASAFSFIAWSKACAVLGVVRTTLCLYLEPVIGVVFAALFLGERLMGMGVCGGLIIIAGVVVATWRRKGER